MTKRTLRNSSPLNLTPGNSQGYPARVKDAGKSSGIAGRVKQEAVKQEREKERNQQQQHNATTETGQYLSAVTLWMMSTTKHEFNP